MGDQIMFEVDKYYPSYNWAESPWGENRKYVYNITAKIKPLAILELGVYLGCSFFTFCQSLKDNRLNAMLVGVDTWQGDEHSGFYGDSIYNTFLDILNHVYPQQAVTICKNTFDIVYQEYYSSEAPGFDIIHIDGLHTYEAVKHDYEQWVNMLNPNGVMIFHDIKVERFGVKDFWKEISKNTLSYTINNVNGLGVLFPAGNKFYEQCRP